MVLRLPSPPGKGTGGEGQNYGSQHGLGLSQICRNRPLSGVEGDILARFWLRLRSANIVSGTVTICQASKKFCRGNEAQKILFCLSDDLHRTTGFSTISLRP